MVRLEDLADEVTVGHVGSMASEYKDEGVVFLRSQNVKPFRIDLADVKCVSKRFHSNLQKSALREGDVVLVRTGDPGACAVIPKEFGEVNCADLVIVRPGGNLDSRYLMYFINLATHHVKSHLVGAVQQHFNVGAARKMEIALPRLAEQRRIASTLGALDDKIELNRKMNQTLEEIAQTLFRAWFVDFEGEADLVESELGPAPRKWEQVSVGDCIELAYGKSLPKQRREPGTIEVYGSGGRVGSHDVALVNGPGIVVGRKGTVGSVYWTDSDYWPIDTTFYVKVRDHRLTLLWVYFRLRNMNLEKLTSDSAVPGINRNAVYSRVWFIPPSPEPVEEFDRVVKPLMARARVNRRQSRTLAELRDTLLPKLISGEIRVPEAAELAEDAGASPP